MAQVQRPTTAVVRRFARAAAARARTAATLYRATPLLRSDADAKLVRTRTRLLVGYHDRTLTTSASIERNLELATAPLRRAGIPYFAVPTISENRTRVGVDAHHRDAVLSTLRSAYRDAAVFIDLEHEQGVRRSVLAADLDQAVAGFGSPSLCRVFRYQSWPSGALVSGALHGSEIEFWEPVDGQLVAPFHNRVCGAIPSDLATTTTQLRGAEHPTIEPFARGDYVDRVTFPVDLVYALGARDRDDGGRTSLRFALRSLWAYGEGFRTVHVVVDDAAPAWLDTARPDVNVVRGRDIGAEGGSVDLAALVRIDGVSDHFVVLDDRVFFSAPARPSSFFLSNGVAQLVRNRQIVDPDAPIPAKLSIAPGVRRGAELLRAHTRGRAVPTSWPAPQPVIRSAASDLAVAVRDTSGNASAPVDPTWHGFWAYQAGLAIPGSTTMVAVRPGLAGLRDLARARRGDAFSLPSGATPGDNAVARWFPWPGAFEREE